ncbi:MAG TPA: transglycosylase domain-containing protein [Candidatus Paceibacterota bacterium]|nr:transglycosylase domain-containing protein [Candidatus Paceibacterota bacterium]
MSKKNWRTLLKKHLESPNPLVRALFIGAGVFFLVCGVAILSVAFTPIPDLNSFDARKVSESTKIYDREGKTILYDLNHDMRRNVVPLSAMSKNLQLATIAIEDDKFYQHSGVRLTSFIRAVLVDLREGAFVQGGSTITQQVVKNTILTGKKSPIRKVQEWILAWKLEGKYTKDEILEFYLNVTPYGGTLYGAEAASRSFFGKSASDLTLAEAAYLAALPQAPTYYSPYGNNRPALEARKERVLDRMLTLGYIDEASHASAKAEQVTFARMQGGGIIAPHFVFYVEQYLEQKYGADVVNQGLTIITTLDTEMQNDAEEIVNRYALANEGRFDAENAALVALDPKTGQILSMVGSRNYFDPNIDGNYNIALAPRQPGSAFKPFVYATALLKGYTPESILFDLPTQFSTRCSPGDVYNSEAPCYAPGNYDQTFRGPMTFTTALQQSINIPAVQTLYLAGIKNVIDLATRMGIEGLGDPKEYGLSFALGAAEVRLLDLTSAYGVFGNDGIRHKPTGILEVRDRKGKVLEKFEERGELVLDTNVARQMAAIMSNNEARVPAYNPNNPLTIPGYDVAAKTGTTNESRDAWTVGYTPTLAVGAWAGNNNNRPMVKEIAGYIVAPMWNEFMQKALPRRENQVFAEPAPTPSDLHPALRGQALVQTPGGTTAHSLLHWTNKDNPRGPAPAAPWLDPQYQYWESPIQSWLAAGGAVAPRQPQEQPDEQELLEQLNELIEQAAELQRQSRPDIGGQ